MPWGPVRSAVGILGRRLGARTPASPALRGAFLAPGAAKLPRELLQLALALVQLALALCQDGRPFSKLTLQLFDLPHPVARRCAACSLARVLAQRFLQLLHLAASPVERELLRVRLPAP